jgi:hypothetical protein
MGPGGQIVAIIPRSFCNGPYYRPFRDFFQRGDTPHTFVQLAPKRSKMMVCCKNIIIALERGGNETMSQYQLQPTTPLPIL